jgi:hypothetical protein
LLALAAPTQMRPVARLAFDAESTPAVVLAQLLAAPDVVRGRLTLLLSNHYVRYLILPWNDAISGRTELGAMASHAFAAHFGAPAAGWAIQTSPESAGRPRLAAAADIELLSALQAAVASSRLHLASIVPYLVTAFNRLAPSLRRRDFLFLLAEPGRACLLAAAGGQLRAAQSRAVEDSLTALADLVERERELLELQDEGGESGHLPILFHAPGRPDLQLPPISGAAVCNVVLCGRAIDTAEKGAGGELKAEPAADEAVLAMASTAA